MPWEWPVGALCAFMLALVATPAGVSGAVLLLPIQLSVLGVPSPAVTPTNLLFNVTATPGALVRFRQEQRLASPLTGLLVAGTLPGVVVGAVLRVEFLSSERATMLIAAGVLIPIGLWLTLGSQSMVRRSPPSSAGARRVIWLAAVLVGTVGGLYGIGGGSLLAPLLMLAGFSAYEVAPATLTSTFLTSVIGVATYVVLQHVHGGSVAPEWPLAAWVGAGGFLGSYAGARLQRRLPEHAIRRLLGLLACAVGARYLQLGAGSGSTGQRAAGARGGTEVAAGVSGCGSFDMAHAAVHVRRELALELRPPGRVAVGGPGRGRWVLPPPAASTALVGIVITRRPPAG
jgi:uncharacterized protein